MRPSKRRRSRPKRQSDTRAVQPVAQALRPSRDDHERRRAAAKALRAELPALRKQLAQLAKDQAEVAARVERGELTQRALTPLEADAERLRQRIFRATNEAVQTLRETGAALFPELAADRRRLLRKRADANRALQGAADRLAETRRACDNAAERVERTAEHIKRHGADSVEHDRACEKLSALRTELEEGEQHVAELEATLIALTSELDANARRCCDA